MTISSEAGVEWWQVPDTVHSVASHAVHEGELTTAQEALDFFEKPWHYPELYTNWLEAGLSG